MNMSNLRDVRVVEAAGESSFVRPLGAFERMYYRFEQRRTMNFMVAAEFPMVLTEEQVQSALRATQARHPLLRVHIQNDPAEGPAFHSPEISSVPEVSLTVVKRDHRRWQSAASDEFLHKIDNSQAPLLRATLVTGEAGSTILLTFSHVVADGMSAVFILEDIVASLNGNDLEPLPVPPTQEELIAKVLPTLDASVLGDLPTPAPEMAALVSFEATGDSTPKVYACTVDSNLTAKIVSRCRAEKTTVQGLLVAAFSQVRSAHLGEEFVRVLTPINFRGLIGVEKDCADYITAARTGSSPLDGSSIWDQARKVSEELSVPRSVTGVTVGSMAIQHLLPPDVSGEVVEGFMNAQLAHEMQVSNLGVLDFAPSGPIRPDAIWGPMILLTISNEVNSGITTFDGKLRIVTSSRVAEESFLDDVQALLASAISE
ncbi:condensation domain-containing protein [Streptomyces sp. NPDC087659]|uniref:condensation domain-containing protein n=1 Tax=Streptomyces sp. NPDC087659 TaxID=3365801 RepID=UPI0037FC5A89